MIDPRENTDYDPREELKAVVSEKLSECGYPFEWILPNDNLNITMVKFILPKGQLSITLKQASRQPMANIKALIDAAMNQDEIKAGLPSNPVAPDDEISIE